MNGKHNHQLVGRLRQLLPENLGHLVATESGVCIRDEVIGEPMRQLVRECEDYVQQVMTAITTDPKDNYVNIVDNTAVHLMATTVVEDMSVRCDVILDALWERINCGEWRKVATDFRYCFGYASLLKAVIRLVPLMTTITTADDCDNGRCFDHKLAALNALDFGLLMSPKLTDSNTLAKTATIVHKAISDCRHRSIVKDNHEFSSGDNRLNKRFKRSTSDELNDCDNNTTTFGAKQSVIILSNKTSMTTADDVDYQSLIPYFKNRSNNQIKRVECLDFETFLTDYIVAKQPVIITDCMSDWPALKGQRKWSVDYIRRVAGYRTVPIEIGSKYTDEEWSQKLVTINEFIDKYLTDNNGQPGNSGRTGYLAQHNLFDQIEELMADISVPDYCSITDSDTVDVDINAWFGPSGTVSPLHYDPKDNLLAQVFGSKYVRLYPADTPAQAIYPNDSRLLSNTSQVDLENVDAVRFPEFNRLDHYWECVLNEGEMLFMPNNYWHFVKSLSTSFSISFWWK